MLRRMFVWPVVALFVSTAAVAYTVLTIHPKQSVAAQDAVSTVARPIQPKIHSGSLWPQLRFYLHALGDRMEQSGKERLTVAGTLAIVGDGPATVSAVFELPDRLRLTTQLGTQVRTISSDGKTISSVGAVTDSDQGLVESLVRDSAEHFFSLQAQGAPTRHLGDHFRMDDGSSPNYEGPLFDVYSVTDITPFGNVKRSLPKFYYFNSQTRLLERVTYQIFRNGQTVEVETRFGGWQKTDDEQVAQQVFRFENGKQVFALTLASVSVGPQVNDALF